MRKEVLGLLLVLVCLCGCNSGQRLEQRVGNTRLSLYLPEGWKSESSGPNGSSWNHGKLGHLAVEVMAWASVVEQTRVANTLESAHRVANLERWLTPVAKDSQVALVLAKLADIRTQKLTVSAALGPMISSLRPTSQVGNEAEVRLQGALTGLIQDPVQVCDGPGRGKMLLGPSLGLLWCNDHLVLLRFRARSELAGLMANAQFSLGSSPVAGIPLWVWSPLLVVLLATSWGAYSGYQSDPTDPARGAAQGAHGAGFWLLNLLLVVALGGLWSWALQTPTGSGGMSPAVLAGGLTLVGLPGGMLLSYCYGLGAALAAQSAAKQGARAAALVAPLGGMVGITCSLLTLTVLHFLNPVRRRRKDYTKVHRP